MNSPKFSSSSNSFQHLTLMRKQRVSNSKVQHNNRVGLSFGSFLSILTSYAIIKVDELYMNLLLAGILLTNIILLAGLAIAFLKIRSIYSDIRAQFIDFVTPPADNKPSKLSLVVEAMSEMVGRSLVASLKGFLMGSKSGEVRADNAEAGRAMDGGALGGIIQMLPKSVKQSLIKNPALLDLAMGFMAKQGNGAGGAGRPAGSNHSETSQVKFKL